MARSMMRMLMLIATLTASVGLAGCTGGEEPLPAEWRGRDLRQPGWTNSSLQPEWTLVLEYPLSSGARLEWDWFMPDESRQLYFQVVMMEGNRPVKMVARHYSEDASALTAPKAGVYQVIWMNDGFLPQNFTWSAREGYSQRMYPPNEGPGCLAAARGSTCLSLPDLPPSWKASLDG